MHLGFSSPLSSPYSAAIWFVAGHADDVDEMELRAASTHHHKGNIGVDRPSHSPYAGSMELHVPPDLAVKLNRLAEGTGRNAEQLALDLLATSVEHDEWFRREVEKGRLSAREGRLLDHDELLSRIDRRYGG